jgi:opacity protein-like surface antigen
MKANIGRLILGLAGLLAVSAPAWAQDPSWGRRYRHDYDSASEFRLWLGGFRPDESSDYWRGVRQDFTGSRQQDLENPIFGADFILRLDRYWAIIFSGSYYEGSTTQAYRNFVDNSNNAILHDQTLDVGSFTVGALVHFAPGYRVNPYLGAGVGVYTYRLREEGDFIDFSQAGKPIFRAALDSNGTTFGGYVMAGIDIRVAHSISLFAEGRYSKASKDLTGDFANFGKLDLSGGQIEGGVSFHLR